ncbi:MAG: hypothetical protein J2P48_16355, partial [Alphaproteobacteria bacterium]|nr:hypothetical protein [Alphaproteobacteria bacterium]
MAGLSLQHCFLDGIFINAENHAKSEWSIPTYRIVFPNRISLTQKTGHDGNNFALSSKKIFVSA